MQTNGVAVPPLTCISPGPYALHRTEEISVRHQGTTQSAKGQRFRSMISLHHVPVDYSHWSLMILMVNAQATPDEKVELKDAALGELG
jgi:hypothetical protein